MKFRPVILISIFSAITFLSVSFWVPATDWTFLPFLLLAGFFMALVQKETVAYDFMDKLLAGSLLFGFLLMALIFLRMYAMSHLVYNSALPFSFLWSRDTLAIAAVFSFVSFLGGLAGVVLKGFYALYGDRIGKIIIFFKRFF